MEAKFAAAVEALHASFERLLSLQPLRNGVLPKSMPEKGVYLFSEGDRHLYVGRSNNLSDRYEAHCSASERKAAFAFKMARSATGKVKASYRPGAESREGLMRDATFRDAFQQASARIRKMDYRYVEETDPTRQALLEIYCAITLSTPYNDFENH